jgi:hypothetical protein
MQLHNCVHYSLSSCTALVLSTEATATATAVIGARNCASAAAMPMHRVNRLPLVKGELMCYSDVDDDDDFTLFSFDTGTPDRFELTELVELAEALKPLGKLRRPESQCKLNCIKHAHCCKAHV